MYRKLNPIALGILALSVGGLAACGGGSDTTGSTDTTTPPASTLVTITGTVFTDGAIKNAVVCMDVNANGVCDSTEPVSAATGADGAYSITYDTSKVSATEVATASLIAPQVPGTLTDGKATIDMADPTSTNTQTAYVLKQVPGKAGQINPLTTLVATGMASGLTLADSTAAVAVQLGITEAETLDYQANAAFDPLAIADSARTLAKVVADTLEAGLPIGVTGLAAKEDPSSQQAQFNFTDLNNYYVRAFTATDKAGGLRQTADIRTGKTAGVDTAQSVLFQTAYLTKAGWTRCDAAGFDNTRGTPTRSAYCAGGQQSTGFTKTTDIAGKSMGDTLRAMQAATDGSNTVNMNPALVDGKTFPAGSLQYSRTTVLLGDTIWINNLNSTNDILSGANYASLETFIKSRPQSAVKLAPKANNGLVWLGFTEDLDHYLYGAFTDEVSGVQYYSCTIANSTADTCAEVGKGSFKIATKNGVRLIQFAGQPNPVAYPAINFTVGYAEYAPGIMARYRQTRPDATVTHSVRMNSTAGDALRSAVGL